MTNDELPAPLCGCRALGVDPGRRAGAVVVLDQVSRGVIRVEFSAAWRVLERKAGPVWRVDGSGWFSEAGSLSVALRAIRSAMGPRPRVRAIEGIVPYGPGGKKSYGVLCESAGVALGVFGPARRPVARDWRSKVLGRRSGNKASLDAAARSWCEGYRILDQVPEVLREVEHVHAAACIAAWAIGEVLGPDEITSA